MSVPKLVPWPYEIDRLAENRYEADDRDWFDPIAALKKFGGTNDAAKSELVRLAGTSRYGAGVIQTAAERVVITRRRPTGNANDDDDASAFDAYTLHRERPFLPPWFWTKCAPASQYWSAGLFIARDSDLEVFAEGVRFDKYSFEAHLAHLKGKGGKETNRNGRHELQWHHLMAALVRLAESGRLTAGGENEITSAKELLTEVMRHSMVRDVEFEDAQPEVKKRALPANDTTWRQIEHLWDRLHGAETPGMSKRSFAEEQSSVQ